MLKVFRFLKHNLIAVIGAVTLVSITAYASGLWSDFPILNGASYCNSFIAVGTSLTPGGTNAAGGCVSTIPAGPTMTGLETIPADTNATQGQTATVKINLATLGVGPYVYVTPITGATLTLTMFSVRLLSMLARLLVRTILVFQPLLRCLTLRKLEFVLLVLSRLLL